MALYRGVEVAFAGASLRLTAVRFRRRLFRFSAWTALGSGNGLDGPGQGDGGRGRERHRLYGSTLPGFMMPAGSIAALIRCISASSAPPRQSGIM
jgi:hypothetical protein